MAELRWRLADDDGDQLPLLAVDELTRPVYGSGRMSGLEFLHVAAKRILNPVPASSRMPFRWTINVYRGCSHACVYCLAGDTPILMADGRTKPLADMQVGDRVYGTEPRGSHRHYVPTEVLAHWRTCKPAYRVTLEDETTIVASGDHRLLTSHGWVRVAAKDHQQQLGYLQADDELIGVGHLTDSPHDDPEYRCGYLTGMIRSVRLPLVDQEPLDRIRGYLSGFVTTTVQQLICVPEQPTIQWRKGFLAAVFDAEGSYRGGVLRIANEDPTIIDQTAASLTALGFRKVVESRRRNGIRSLRVAGGLREHLRFFLMTDPATTRKRAIDNVTLPSDVRLRVVSVEPLDVEIPMYDITTGTGDFIADGVVSHNCFARPTHEYLGLNLGEDFDRKIVVKINAVERVRAELAAPTWSGEPIAMGTNTDPYQRCEAKYRITRGVLEALTARANPFSILTKSPLVIRDVDILAEAARRADVQVNLSIGTLDERVWRATEPGTPHPRRRVDAVRQLAEAGIRTGALIAPVVPGMSDHPDQLTEVAAEITRAGARVLGVLPLHLRPGTREHFLRWLAGHDRALHADYLRRYATSAYAPPRYAQRLQAIVTAAAASQRREDPSD